MLDSASNRRLFIDFDTYTDGDNDFKKELVVSMVDNLKELSTSVVEAVQQKQPTIFDKTCHKIKPTLTMLEDPGLQNIINQTKVQLADNKDTESAIKNITEVCEQIIKSLEDEIRD